MELLEDLAIGAVGGLVLRTLRAALTTRPEARHAARVAALEDLTRRQGETIERLTGMVAGIEPAPAAPAPPAVPLIDFESETSETSEECEESEADSELPGPISRKRAAAPAVRQAKRRRDALLALAAASSTDCTSSSEGSEVAGVPELSSASLSSASLSSDSQSSGSETSSDSKSSNGRGSSGLQAAQPSRSAPPSRSASPAPHPQQQPAAPQASGSSLFARSDDGEPLEPDLSCWSAELFQDTGAGEAGADSGPAASNDEEERLVASIQDHAAGGHLAGPAGSAELPEHARSLASLQHSAGDAPPAPRAKMAGRLGVAGGACSKPQRRGLGSRLRGLLGALNPFRRHGGASAAAAACLEAACEAAAAMAEAQAPNLAAEPEELPQAPAEAAPAAAAAAAEPAVDPAPASQPLPELERALSVEIALESTPEPKAAAEGCTGPEAEAAPAHASPARLQQAAARESGGTRSPSPSGLAAGEPAVAEGPAAVRHTLARPSLAYAFSPAARSLQTARARSSAEEECDSQPTTALSEEPDSDDPLSGDGCDSAGGDSLAGRAAARLRSGRQALGLRSPRLGWPDALPPRLFPAQAGAAPPVDPRQPAAVASPPRARSRLLQRQLFGAESPPRAPRTLHARPARLHVFGGGLLAAALCAPPLARPGGAVRSPSPGGGESDIRRPSPEGSPGDAEGFKRLAAGPARAPSNPRSPSPDGARGRSSSRRSLGRASRSPTPSPAASRSPSRSRSRSRERARPWPRCAAFTGRLGPDAPAGWEPPPPRAAAAAAAAAARAAAAAAAARAAAGGAWGCLGLQGPPAACAPRGLPVFLPDWGERAGSAQLAQGTGGSAAGGGGAKLPRRSGDAVIDLSG